MRRSRHARGPLHTVTRDVLDLIGSSWMSQAACTMASLGVADYLLSGARTLPQLAARIGADADALGRLVLALEAIGLCEMQRHDFVAITPRGALLARRHPNSLYHWAIWWGQQLWPLWQELPRSVRSGRGARLSRGDYGHISRDPQAAAIFDAAMGELTASVAGEIASCVSFPRDGRVVDLGGGRGELMAAILSRHKSLTGCVLELPHVVSKARAFLRDAGLGRRCRVIAGNFTAAVPADADVYLMKSVMHNWDDADGLSILSRCSDAMSQRAKLVLIERLVPPRSASLRTRRAQSRADLNMLLSLGGRERTRAEIGTLLRTAGFVRAAFTPTASDYWIIETARKSSARLPSNAGIGRGIVIK